MNPYRIYFWHGLPDENSEFMKKVNRVFHKDEKTSQYYWYGTLDEFVKQWGDKFIYFPSKNEIDDFGVRIFGTIAITPYGGFGTR